MPVLACRRVYFYSNTDETAFFCWLNSIKSIRKFEATGDTIWVHVPKRISKSDLREIVSIFERYHIEMTQLAQLRATSDSLWFADPAHGWHKPIFKKKRKDLGVHYSSRNVIPLHFTLRFQDTRTKIAEK